MNELIRKADELMMACEANRIGLLSDEWLIEIEDAAFKELELVAGEEYVDTIRELKYAITNPTAYERADDLRNHIIPELHKFTNKF
tara:strand:- start:113 stop:370 length:258 start_codon:yes stop_codon:yes gene_type:complete